VVGFNSSNTTVTNSYYNSSVYSGNAIGFDSSTATNVEGKTAAQFASGEVAYLLNGDQSTITFKQTIGEDAYPNFTGETVYAVTGCNGENVIGYSNTEGEKEDHAFGADGKCTNDGCTAIAYKLWVGGEQFTSEKLTINGTTGTATYDPENNTLTLNNYTYEGAGYTWNEPYGNGYFMKFSAAICYGGTDPIRLVLNGESTVVHTGTSNGVKSCGIYTNGSIEILDGGADGIGSLTANGGPTMDDYSYGVYARGCSINVTSGSLTANGGRSEYSSSYGMYAYNGSIEVTGGSLTGIGGEAYNSTGVWADEDIVISGSGTVVATGGDSEESSRGVATYGSIQVTGGSLTATIGKGMGDVSYGVYASDGLTMGTGYGIVTPVGGKFDAEQRKVVDAEGNYATEVKIAEKPVTYYDLWVGGAQVTSEKLTITDEDGGTATYAPETNTLTLDGYRYTGAGYEYAAIYYGGSGTLKLVLVNDNSITYAGSSDLSYGIYANNGRITISGSGSLTAIGGEVNVRGMGESYGIYVSGGNLTILGGTVTATGGKASGSYSADSCGIYVRGTITISGGTVTATGGEVSDGKTAGCSSTGLYAYGEIHISGGTVTAASGTVNGEYSADSKGVLAYGGLTLGEGIGILTPVGGSYDAEQRKVVDADGNIATEVRIAEMPDPVKVQLKLTKEFNGWGKADGFTFNLAAVTENAPMPASPSATATEETPLAYFGEITFTAAGIYEYTITEVNSGIPGVTYDTSAHEVVVTIENTEDNKLIAEVKYDGGLSLIITNTYTEATRYNLWIGGTQVTSHNAADVFGDGKVSYDAIENTLTLNGYTYTGEGYTWDEYSNAYSAAIYYSGTEPLNLILKGESTVTHTGNGNLFRSYGLYANDDVVVTEDGDGGSLTITGSVASQESYGVYFQDDFNDNYEMVGGSLTLNSGSLTATGDVANGRSCGVYAYSITVTGGSLTANGGTADISSYGAYVFGGSITVTGGTVTATGGDASSFSYGVDIAGYDGNLTVTGGSLTAISGTAGVNSIAVSTHGLTMGEGFGILTPTGGRLVDGIIFDAEGTYATEVEIGAGYTVTAAFDSVDEKNVGGTVTGTGFYRAGTEVTLTVTPDLGCSFVSLTMNGTDVTNQVENGQYTFTMPACNVAVTVTMERLFTLYDLWVGGERFTDKKLTVNGSTGTATYDPVSNTLTLDGYTYEGAGHTWEEAGWDDTPIHYGAAIYYSGTETLNLVLNGENTVTHTGSADMSESYGLYAKGNVVVSEGSAGGSLAVTGGTSGNESYGVYANSSITVSGSLTATGGTAEYESYGVYANGSITVPGSLTATGGMAGRSYGVYANTSITVSGSLTATGGTVGYESYGVYSNGSITVSGSLTATGGAAEFSYGVLAYDGLTMGTGIGILTPEGGYFNDNGWYTVVDADGNPATEVRIAKSAPKVILTDGNLTVTNTSVEADETVDMTIMVAGYTGGKMTRCQVIEDVTGVTEIDLAVTGDTIKVFFLNPDTYAPLFAYAEP